MRASTRSLSTGRKQGGSINKKKKEKQRVNQGNEKSRQSSWTKFRFGVVIITASYFILERATVFAAPSPIELYSSHGKNSTIVSRPVIPISREEIKIDHLPDHKIVHELEDDGHSSQSKINETQNEIQGQLKLKEEEESNEDLEANLAFFIQISPSTINHLPRLLSKIYHEKNVYAIHLDLKISDEQRKNVLNKLYKITEYKRNVHIMESELITYRGVSMLLNTINAIRLLLDVDKKWDYFINISGSDYPLIDAKSQRKLLGIRKGLNFFTYAPTTSWKEMAINRLSEIWYDESLTFQKQAKKGYLQNLKVINPLIDEKEFTIAHCEAWMIISREFSDFIIRGDMSRKMLLSFGYSADSSEHYFGSLAWNNEKFKQTLVPHALRLVIWTHQGKPNHSGQHPYNVDEKDKDGNFMFKKVLNETVLLFARKFENVDSDLMKFLDKRASRKDVITSVEQHLVAKIEKMQQRIAEL